jgi:DNA-binding MarR family transcriptional regulator
VLSPFPLILCRTALELSLLYRTAKKSYDTLKEIADFLDVHYTTISKVIKAYEEEN